MTSPITSLIPAALTVINSVDQEFLQICASRPGDMFMSCQSETAGGSSCVCGDRSRSLKIKHDVSVNTVMSQ